MIDLEERGTSTTKFYIAVVSANLFINAAIAIVGPLFPIEAGSKGISTRFIGYIFRYSPSI